MIRATIVRVLLAALLAVSCVCDGAQAQNRPPINSGCDGPCPLPPPGPQHHNNNVVWYIVGGVAVGVLGWLLGTKIFGDPKPDSKPDFTSSLPPDPIPLTSTTLLPASRAIWRLSEKGRY